MKKSASTLTLLNIKRIISGNNSDLAKMMDEKLARNNVAIFGAIDSSVERLERRINDFENKVNQRFDMVGDQLQEVIQAASEITDQKLKEFKQKYLAA